MPSAYWWASTAAATGSSRRSSPSCCSTRARRGKTVVRLKGGDPFIFGRGGEEGEALAAAGIPFEMVPGVSAALAVPAYAGIPLTHRDLASSFTVLTGYEYPDKAEMAVHWDAVAQRGGTLVILMTTRQLRVNMARLIAHGVAADTPVAVIRWGSVAEQTTMVGTAATIADLAAARMTCSRPRWRWWGRRAAARAANWFERKPLFGRRIVVTRPRAQAAELRRAARAPPAPKFFPVRRSRPYRRASLAPLDEAIERIERFDWLVFTSANGVAVFFDRLRALGRDVRRCIGHAWPPSGRRPRAALAARGLLVDVDSERVSRRGGRGGDALGRDRRRPRSLAARRRRRARSCRCSCARRARSWRRSRATGPWSPTPTCTRCASAWRRGGSISITFTSSSTVRNFSLSWARTPPALLARTRIGCIGPITADTVREAGMSVAIQPADYTVPAFAEAIVDYFARQRRSAGRRRKGR